MRSCLRSKGVSSSVAYKIQQKYLCLPRHQVDWTMGINSQIAIRKTKTFVITISTRDKLHPNTSLSTALYNRYTLSQPEPAFALGLIMLQVTSSVIRI